MQVKVDKDELAGPMAWNGDIASHIGLDEPLT